MSRLLIALLCVFAFTTPAVAADLKPEEVEKVQSDIRKIMAAVQAGDASTVVNMTHPSLVKSVGGKAELQKMTLDALAQIKEANVKFLSNEVGAPSRIYTAGPEEASLVPTTAMMEVSGRKVKSTGFMVAIRKKNTNDWSYVDGAGFQDMPNLLEVLLPQIEKGVPLPPSKTEIQP
jgi:hypothetical protein